MNHLHTPGAWVAQTYSPGTDQNDDPFEDQYRVVTRPINGLAGSECEVASGIQVDADAMLIAAAPKLLAALRALTAVVESYEYGRPWPGRPHTQMDEARAAIARATGGVQ